MSRQPSPAERPARPGSPQRIGEVISRLLARKGYARELAVAQYQSIWAEVAGSEWSADSRPACLRRGVLEVTVRSSTVLHELSFRKQDLLAQVRARLPAGTVSDIRFRVGQVDW